MLRMSFLEHLEELRKRLILALAGLGVAFVVSLTFSERLWMIVQEPAAAALNVIGLYRTRRSCRPSPMEVVLHHLGEAADADSHFPRISLAAVPGMVLCRAWACINGSGGSLRRLSSPPQAFSSPGGLFAYFVAFRFGLTFLLGIGQSVNVKPMITSRITLISS